MKNLLKNPFKGLGLSIPTNEIIKKETIFTIVSLAVLTASVFAVDSVVTMLILR